MAKEEYIVDGYQFSNKAEYDRAKREKETIAYLTAKTDISDRKALLKIYNRSVEKGSFQTIIGQQFLTELRKQLVGSGIVSEDTLAPIRIVSGSSSERDSVSQDKKEIERELVRYQKAYENAVAHRTIKNMLITVLVLVIVGMLVITATSQYSVFTYFTDYKTKIRNEVVDEMENWQKELEEREANLEKREADIQTGE